MPTPIPHAPGVTRVVGGKEERGKRERKRERETEREREREKERAIQKKIKKILNA